MHKVTDFIQTFLLSSPKKIISAIFILTLTLAIPITMQLVSQQQDIRQRAATCSYTCSGPGACGGNLACIDGCCVSNGGYTVWCGTDSSGNPQYCDPNTQDCATGFNGSMCIAKGSCVMGYSCFSPNECQNGQCVDPNAPPPQDPCSSLTNRPEGCYCGWNYQCASGVCSGISYYPDGTQVAGTCLPAPTPTLTPAPTKTPIPTPTPTVTLIPTINPCLLSTDRPNGCDCRSGEINYDNFCHSGYCDSDGRCNNPPLATLTPTNTPLACDPISDGVPDVTDYSRFLAELRGSLDTLTADCNKNGMIDVYDYTIWLQVLRNNGR